MRIKILITQFIVTDKNVWYHIKKLKKFHFFIIKFHFIPTIQIGGFKICQDRTDKTHCFAPAAYTWDHVEKVCGRTCLRFQKQMNRFETRENKEDTADEKSWQDEIY